MTIIVNKPAGVDSEAKGHALIAYILMAVGLFTAVPLLAGAVWAMLTRRGASGTIYHSHLTNAIRVFWWSLFWTVIGFILVFVLVGYAILGIAWLWAFYRLANGLVKIMADVSYPL